ncbi:MAG: FAD-dependent oxidoreductase [Acidimicrobiia bacterium]
MGNASFDIVVVGAGAAGVCCAGELVLQGLRPLLISETPDVGWALRSVIVDGNRGFVQHPIWQIGWGGGWWYGLARRLNAPVQLHVPPPLQLLLRDSGVRQPLYPCASAAAIFDVFARIAPVPIDPVRAEFERVVGEILALEWPELLELTDTPLTSWLEGHGADPILQMVLAVLFANVTETTPAVALEYLSAFGAFAMLRGLVCGEAPAVSVAPDVREGVLVPLVEAIERRGGHIRRAARVRQVTTDGGRVTGLLMEDGEEVRSEVVVLATGTRRVPALLASMPPEVEAAVTHSASLGRQDICTYTVLGEPVVDLENITMVADADGSNLAYLFPMHAVAPWSTQPGKQMLVAQAFYPQAQFDAMGGAEGAAKHLLDLQDELFPGFAKATEATARLTHRHYWLDPLVHGPKLPSTTDAIRGLWFAGDGSTPVGGIGVDGAAGAGVLRARQVAQSLRA